MFPRRSLERLFFSTSFMQPNAGAFACLDQIDHVASQDFGTKACIVHRASKKCIHPYGGASQPPQGAEVLLHGDCCFERTFFTMEPTGVIKHVASGYCLHSDTEGNVSLGNNCTTRFIQVDGKLSLEDDKNLCLSPKYHMSTPQDNEPLAMTRNCTEAFDLMISRPGLTSEVSINTDFIRVDIKRKQDVVTEVHMNTALKPEVLKRPVTAGIPVSVCMIMFDSTSAANFQRKMPKSIAHMKTLPTVFLKGNTIVGDGTTAQVTAMLTGIAEAEQPEARRKMANAKPVDDWRFIFKDYKKHGYATLYTEDSPSLGTFNYRLKGFENPPTDHYGRYFWIEGDKHIQKEFCVGNERYHLVSLRYYLSLFRTYKKNPKFMYMIQSQISHGGINGIQYADEDLVDFFKTLENENHLNNTIVFVFGDHGARFGELRKTLQGKLEERLPHMSVTFPKWFPEKFPELYKNFEQNSHVLTSPFDIYASLQHLLSYPSLPKGIVTGQSLFTLIDPKNRTCASTGVEEHWCPCLNFEKVSVDDSIVKEIADFVVKHINTLLELNADVKRLCHQLQLKEIKNAQQELPNEKLQLFADTFVDDKCDSCGVKNGDRAVNTLAKDTLYQIQFVTSPNEGFYEASIKLNNGKPSLKGEISRVDAYGKQSICVSETYVHLLKFCYCK
ncbi:uncharacterized protein LOC116604845 isoform X2 [Nematostella vectensis]|uniref:uncharacterized protein LOC116604845 isoform X2 n=1 Tax=Nematostella vectensis TaxID=45351 RepID=UPI0020770F01|nr:uncharacterized protein LOC116604845 isoform X2 [Nematostella vectensis]